MRLRAATLLHDLVRSIVPKGQIASAPRLIGTWIVVARLAPEPVNTNVAVADYYVRQGNDARPQAGLQESPLPPVPEPVPAPVPAPAIQPAAQAFAAQLASENLAPSPGDSASALRKLAGRWSPPPSSLSLTDRLA